MDREPVVSSNIASIGYSEEDSRLQIEFHNGGVYDYFDVPADVHQQVMVAESTGRAFHQLIKGSFEYEKATDDTGPVMEDQAKSRCETLLGRSIDDKVYDECTDDTFHFLVHTDGLFVLNWLKQRGVDTKTATYQLMDAKIRELGQLINMLKDGDGKAILRNIAYGIVENPDEDMSRSLLNQIKIHALEGKEYGTDRS